MVDEQKELMLKLLKEVDDNLYLAKVYILNNKNHLECDDEPGVAVQIPIQKQISPNFEKTIYDSVPILNTDEEEKMSEEKVSLPLPIVKDEEPFISEIKKENFLNMDWFIKFKEELKNPIVIVILVFIFLLIIFFGKLIYELF